MNEVLSVECPKCKKAVGENDVVCKNCGTTLKTAVEKKHKKMSFFNSIKNKSEQSSQLPLLETSAKKKIPFAVNSDNEKKVKIAFMAAAAVLLIVLVWVLIVQISGDKGARKAAQAAEFIGSPLTKAEKDMDVHFKDNSAFDVVNKAAAFDYVYESEDNVSLDGADFPEWAVFVDKNSSDKIESVTYTDYKLLKKDTRGAKMDKKINLDKFDKGVKFGTVSDEIGTDPYKITYAAETTSYIYKYYYKNSSGNEQSIILTSVFDKKGKYLYYTSVDIYPQFA